MATGQTARNAELPDEAALDSGLSHLGFFYRDQRDYLARIEAFTSAGHASGEPVFIAVPGDKFSVLRERLGGPVRSADMAEMGPQPSPDHPGDTGLHRRPPRKAGPLRR